MHKNENHSLYDKGCVVHVLLKEKKDDFFFKNSFIQVREKQNK